MMGSPTGQTPPAYTAIFMSCEPPAQASTATQPLAPAVQAYHTSRLIPDVLKMKQRELACPWVPVVASVVS